MNDNHSLSHSKWNCKYHIVFAPKYRRQVVYGQLKADIGKILRTLCEQKKVNIIEAEACPDHIHMSVSYTHLCIRKNDIVTPEEKLGRYLGVSKERIIAAAKSMVLDSVYVLTGNENREKELS